MGIACSMARVLQQGCGGTTRTEEPPSPCFLYHPDTIHFMTWIVDQAPPDWELPITFEYSDGTTEVSDDGTDAHEFALEGTYTIKGTSADGKTCTVTVTVPSVG